jgi:SAM-dependent methyltransferase
LEAEYDQMAEEYDATRDAATEDELSGIARSLDGSESVLDVGVGTGRFAKPLTERGFSVVGVDVSRRMLLKAKEKGLDRLVLGDAYSLPFRAKAFDAAVTIHLLHIVVDWAKVMREMARVTKGNVITILRVPQGQGWTEQAPAAPPQGGADSQRMRTQHRLWKNEQDLKVRVPPFKLERIRDEIVSLSVTDAIRRLEAKRSMGAQMVPPEMRRAMMDRILAMREGEVVHRRVIEDLAVWKAEQLESLD